MNKLIMEATEAFKKEIQKKLSVIINSFKESAKYSKYGYKIDEIKFRDSLRKLKDFTNDGIKKIKINKTKWYKCEWCGMEYPLPQHGGYEYYGLQVFKNFHIICEDCKKRLKMLSKLEAKYRKVI